MLRKVGAIAIIRILTIGLGLAAAVLAVLPAQAQPSENECGTRAEAILRTLYPKAKQTGDQTFTVGTAKATISTDKYLGSLPYAMVCRRWPAQPDYLLVALPLITRDDGSETMGDIDVAVLQNDSLRPIARHRVVDMIDDDAIALDLLEFDTAPYRLVEGRRAFGLRASQANWSRVAQFSQTSLWLFDLNGSSLRPVLERFEVDRGSSDWDGSCAGTFDNLTRTIALDAGKDHGAAGLLITTHAQTTESAPNKAGDCDQTAASEKTSHARLPYDGKLYVVPDEMKVVE